MDKIPVAWRALVEQAVAALARAYAPYSKFRVGSAVEDERGKIFSGCNVENVSYSLAYCAERTAVVKMVSEGGSNVKRIALVTSSAELCFPCGSCRQVLREFGLPQVFAMNVSGTQFRELSLDALLPESFSGEQFWKR